MIFEGGRLIALWVSVKKFVEQNSSAGFWGFFSVVLFCLFTVCRVTCICPGTCGRKVQTCSVKSLVYNSLQLFLYKVKQHLQDKYCHMLWQPVIDMWIYIHIVRQMSILDICLCRRITLPDQRALFGFCWLQKAAHWMATVSHRTQRWMTTLLVWLHRILERV